MAGTTPAMKTSLGAAGLLSVLSLALPSTAAADTLLQGSAGNDTSHPAVAYNSNADQYLVVYQANRRLDAQIRDADGTLIDTIVGILPSYGTETVYREPRVTYREGSDQYVMTAVLEHDTGFIPEVDVTVTGLDPNGGVQWTFDAPKDAGDTLQRTPDVLADTFPGAGCCTLVTWKTSYGTIYAQQYNSDGAEIGSRMTVYNDTGATSSHAFNPRIAYGRLPNDEFVVVYQLARNGNPGQIWARTVQPVSGALGTPVLLATMDADPWPRFGQKFPGGPDIAYDEVGDTYYVAWRDESRVYVARPDANLTGSHPYIMLDEAGAYDIRPGTPEVIVADGFGKAFVSHPVSWTPYNYHWVTGRWFSRTGVFAPTSFSTSIQYQPVDHVGGGFSTVTNQAFGVWEVDEALAVSPPPNDLYYALGSVP